MGIGDIDRDTVEEGTDVWNSMRIVTHDGTPLTRAQFTTWNLFVWELESGSTVYSLTAQPNTDSATFLFFDTLQVGDGFWSAEDPDGYNARHFMRQADLPVGVNLQGGASYQFEYEFVTSAFGVLRKKFVWDVTPSRQA